MNERYRQVCDIHSNWRIKSVRDERRKAKCCTKEGLIEDDEKLDTGNQLEGGGQTGGGFGGNLETEGGNKDLRRQDIFKDVTSSSIGGNNHM